MTSPEVYLEPLTDEAMDARAAAFVEFIACGDMACIQEYTTPPFPCLNDRITILAKARTLLETEDSEQD